MTSHGDFKVVIVDDDFMIVRLHSRYIDTQSGFKVVGTATSAVDTLSLVNEHQPDLVILDVYLPGTSGIELLSMFRSKKIGCDVILITAAKELDVIEDAFRLGVFDYLVKPFNIDRLGMSLHKYSQFRAQLSSSATIDQNLVDELRTIRAVSTSKRTLNESGIDIRTLDLVKVCLQSNAKPCSSEDIAAMAGVSRSTARVYLDYLVDEGIAKGELMYGNVGRPRRLFHLV